MISYSIPPDTSKWSVAGNTDGLATRGQSDVRDELPEGLVDQVSRWRVTTSAGTIC